MALLSVFAAAARAVERPAVLRLSADDRLLVLAPHPDDEVLGCGGAIREAVERGVPVRVVFLTNGDDYEWSFLLYRGHPVLGSGAARAMGKVRAREASEAARRLGLRPGDVDFLGYPDRGTLAMWYAHWNDRPPFRSALTRATAVPYPDAFRPGAPYKGEELLRDLARVVREFKPTKIFVSHTADHHPDHRSLPLYLQVALWDLRLNPAVLPYLIHYRAWPAPAGYHPSLPEAPPASLAALARWLELPLNPEEVADKRRALEAHASQFKHQSGELLSFVRASELFGGFPAVTVSSRSATWPADIPPAESLTIERRRRLAGLETTTVRLEGRELVVQTRLARPLGRETAVSVFAFGWRADRPFPEMPKLHVKFGAFAHAVLDQDRRLPAETVRLSRDEREVEVRIPLTALGDPTRLLFSARASLLELPIDGCSWRILELP